jgi:hypothetical protein
MICALPASEAAVASGAPYRQLPGYLEGWEAGRVVEDPKEVAAISTALSMIKSCALSPTDTQQLLGEIRG